MSDIKITNAAKSVVEQMKRYKDGLYKYTGGAKVYISFHASEDKVPRRVLDELLEKDIIKVYDASSFETWYELTTLGKSINI